MTTWTTISNASVAVGAIPSSTLVTALRDNPSAAQEGAAGAPVSVYGWEPVDKVTVGDGKRGLIYDYAVDGSTSAITTPNFVDGYEYRMVVSDLASLAAIQVQYEIYGETTGWVEARRIANSYSSVSSFDIEIRMPRISQRNHISIVNSQGAASNAGYLFGSAQKVRNARIFFTSSGSSQGKAWLFRRREFASAD